MKKIDEETGNKERTVDMKMIMAMASIPTFNKMEGADLVARFTPFIKYISLTFKD